MKGSCIIVVALGAIVCTSEARAGGACRDDPGCRGPNLYLSATVGAGYLSGSESVAGVSTSLSAFTLNLRADAGVRLTRALAVYLEGGYDLSLASPSISIGGHDVQNNASVDHPMVGAGLRYFWTPRDSVAFGLRTSKLDSSNDGMSSSTDWGFGAVIGAAKDWRVAPGVRLGITSDLALDVMNDSYAAGSTNMTVFTWLIGVEARH